MEAINDSTKLVAQAIELIKRYLTENDIESEDYLLDSVVLLENALVKLTQAM